jgi:hypothetical protein
VEGKWREDIHFSRQYTCTINAASCLCVGEAWNAISTQIVSGISLKCDGTEDSKISCIKEGAIASQAKASIEEETLKLIIADTIDDDTDPVC